MMFTDFQLDIQFVKIEFSVRIELDFSSEGGISLAISLTNGAAGTSESGFLAGIWFQLVAHAGFFFQVIQCSHMI